MNRTSLRPTLATVFAAAALLAGAGVVATGLARNSVESRHIKDQTIRSVDLADGSVTGKAVDESTLGTVFFAEAAGNADTALSAGQAETAERLLGMSRISVSAAGELRTDDSGAVDAEQTSTPGRYVVTLGSPSLGCFLITTVAHNGTAPASGSASAWFTPPLQETFGAKVTVETHAPDGNGVPDPLPFNLLVIC